MNAIASIQAASAPQSASSTMRSAVELQHESSFALELKSAAADEDRKTLEQAASALVSSALLMPAMSALENSPWRGGGAFAAGAAERRFAPLLYQRFADEVAKAANFPLVDLMVERLVPKEAKHAST